MGWNDNVNDRAGGVGVISLADRIKNIEANIAEDTRKVAALKDELVKSEIAEREKVKAKEESWVRPGVIVRLKDHSATFLIANEIVTRAVCKHYGFSSRDQYSLIRIGGTWGSGGSITQTRSDIASLYEPVPAAPPTPVPSDGKVSVRLDRDLAHRLAAFLFWDVTIPELLRTKGLSVSLTSKDMTSIRAALISAPRA